MMQSAAMVALMATCGSAFVVPQASLNRLPTASAARRTASSLSMADEPLGVGVIGCGRIGDVSSCLVLSTHACMSVFSLNAISLAGSAQPITSLVLVLSDEQNCCFFRAAAYLVAACCHPRMIYIHAETLVMKACASPCQCICTLSPLLWSGCDVNMESAWRPSSFPPSATVCSAR